MVSRRLRRRASGAVAPPSRPSAGEWSEARATLERLLTENIVPYWESHSIDRRRGGYVLAHDACGKPKDAAPKHLVTQARTMWFFSRLAQTRFGTARHLEAAAHGYRFLRERLWDSDFGGYFWEVDGARGLPVQHVKHLYGQAFAILALAEYSAASGDGGALAAARELLWLIERHAHDGRFGGYREAFERDWSRLPPGRGNLISAPPDGKSMNTHLHLMEALTRLSSLDDEPLAQQRLLELILIQSTAAVRTDGGGCDEHFWDDWSVREAAGGGRVSYGHDLENAWLLISACEAAALPSAPVLQVARAIADHAVAHGFDHHRGGFYASGPPHADADRREKVWWVQAEAMAGTLHLHSRTDAPSYAHGFLRTLRWVVDRQADWKHGDWHAEVSESGRITGDKAGAWKSPFHNGRAVLECLELTERLTALPSPP